MHNHKHQQIFHKTIHCNSQVVIIMILPLIKSTPKIFLPTKQTTNKLPRNNSPCNTPTCNHNNSTLIMLLTHQQKVASTIWMPRTSSKIWMIYWRLDLNYRKICSIFPKSVKWVENLIEFTIISLEKLNTIKSSHFRFLITLTCWIIFKSLILTHSSAKPIWSNHWLICLP